MPGFSAELEENDWLNSEYRLVKLLNLRATIMLFSDHQTKLHIGVIGLANNAQTNVEIIPLSTNSLVITYV
jgi:hypothetical protein